MRDSGGFPTFSIPSFPFLSLVLAYSISTGDPIVRVSFVTTFIYISFLSFTRVRCTDSSKDLQGKVTLP